MVTTSCTFSSPSPFEFQTDSPRSLTPTLQPKWLAIQMLRIIESGLSDHLVAPNSSHLLPLIRSSPEWFRYLLSLQANDLVSNERNKEVRKTYTIAGKLLEGTA
jgi:all-trans-retinol dehydrogenase (NAD+)